MKKLFVAVTLLAAMLFISAPARGQASVFAGYSAAVTQPAYNGFTVAGVKKTVAGSVESQGLEFAAALHVAGPFSAVIDYSNLNRPGNTQLFLGGVEIRQRRGKTLQLFEHGLVGVARSSNTAGSVVAVGPVSVVNSTVAYAVGGGLDVAINKHFAVRVAQIDYLHAPIVGTAVQNQARVSAGLVVTF